MKKTISIIFALLIAAMSIVPAFATETYVLVFKVNTDDVSVIQPEPFICNPENRVAKIAEGPIREGYTFVEWNTAPNGEGVDFEPGGSITMFTSLTLYAIWSENASDDTYTLTYDVNANDIAVVAPNSFTCNKSDNKAIIGDAPYRDGYTFVEWNTSPNGDGMALEPGETITMFTSLTIYAIWDEVEDTATNPAENDTSEESHTGIFQILFLIFKSMIDRFAGLFDRISN